jgi:hypothetical protein
MRVIPRLAGQMRGFQQPANPYKGDDMESRLIKQAIWFAVVLFAWTFFILLVGPK